MMSVQFMRQLKEITLNCTSFVVVVVVVGVFLMEMFNKSDFYHKTNGMSAVAMKHSTNGLQMTHTNQHHKAVLTPHIVTVKKTNEEEEVEENNTPNPFNENLCQLRENKAFTICC